MTCANHPEAPIVAYCRTCGKPLCVECRRTAAGTVYCAEHLPEAASAASPDAAEHASPYTAPAYTPPRPATSSGASPALAFVLGLIPGVGAIYNGQYAKGLVHAVVFGLLVSLIDRRFGHAFGPLIGILIAVWFFYMALEAYHTARRRRDGEQVEEFSSLVEFRGVSGRFPVGAIVLIGVGVLLLLDTTDIIPIDQLLRFWPVALILAGVYLLYARLDSRIEPGEAASREVHNERR